VALDGEVAERPRWSSVSPAAALAPSDPAAGHGVRHRKAPAPLPCAQSMASRRKAVYLLCKTFFCTVYC